MLDGACRLSLCTVNESISSDRSDDNRIVKMSIVNHDNIFLITAQSGKDDLDNEPKNS